MTPDVFAAAIDRGRASRRPHNVARRSYALAMLDLLAGQLATARGLDVQSRRADLIADLRDSPDVRREVNLAWMPTLAGDVQMVLAAWRASRRRARSSPDC